MYAHQIFLKFIYWQHLSSIINYYGLMQIICPSSTKKIAPLLSSLSKMCVCVTQ